MYFLNTQYYSIYKILSHPFRDGSRQGNTGQQKIYAFSLLQSRYLPIIRERYRCTIKWTAGGMPAYPLAPNSHPVWHGTVYIFKFHELSSRTNVGYRLWDEIAAALISRSLLLFFPKYTSLLPCSLVHTPLRSCDTTTRTVRHCNSSTQKRLDIVTIDPSG